MATITRRAAGQFRVRIRRRDQKPLTCNLPHARSCWWHYRTAHFTGEPGVSRPVATVNTQA